MSHLTEEQFEAILQGEVKAPDHIEACSECRALLAEKRALAERLRQTFTSVRASSDLAERLRANLAVSSDGAAATRYRSRTILRAAQRHLRATLAAAAAILLIAVPAALYLGTSSEAHAAHLELVELHQKNLSSMGQLFVHDDPRELAGHLEEETGHHPAMIAETSDMTVCGCCTRRFRGHKIGSYLVETPAGHVSIIVLPNSPESLGMTPDKTQRFAPRTIWHAACEGCNIAMVRIGDRSYCAVGEVTQEDLERVLDNLLR